MSVKQRCFIYCNDCNKKENGWKIVESNEEEDRYRPNKYYKKYCQDKNPCEEKPCKNEVFPNHACTLISVKNPTTELKIPIPSSPGTNIVDITGWTNIVPDPLDSFDNSSGTYTVYEDGDYQIELTINYETSTAIPVDPTLVNVPSIEIYDVDTHEHILASNFSAVSTIIPRIHSIVVSALLSKGQVIINSVVPLKMDQQIRIRASSNGLIYDPATPPASNPRIFLSYNGVDTTLTIFKVRNSPVVVVHCNNC